MTRFLAENTFGLSGFIVDPNPATGFYTTIQSAITAASAAGGGVVYIKSGTYTENLTLANNVQLIGVTGDGRLPTVTIDGSHTAADGIFANLNINFTNSGAGDLFTITPVATFCIFGMKGCGLSTTNGKGFVVHPVAIPCSLLMEQCDGDFSDNFILADGDTDISLRLGVYSSSTATCIRLEDDATFQGEGTQVATQNAGSFCIDVLDNVTIRLGYSSLSAVDTAINMGTVTNQTNLSHCFFSGNAASTYIITGVAGSTLDYAGLMITGTAKNIDPNITQIADTWRPRATAGTSATAYAGVAAFDDTQFTLTDGFVQLANSRVVQQIRSTTSAQIIAANTIPFDTTIPQQTEGTEILTATITPTNAANILMIEANLTGVGLVAGTGLNFAISALFKDAAANAIAAESDKLEQGFGTTLVLRYYMTAGSTAATTFKIRAGSDPVNTTTWGINDDGAGGAIFGGVSVCTLTVTEYTP